MNKLKKLLLLLMSIISLSSCGTRTSSEDINQSEQSESSSTSKLKMINAIVILDYGTIKASKVTPILNKDVEVDVSAKIITAVYGDEVNIRYDEHEENYDVEIIEKELLENITVIMTIAPGAKEGDYECYTNTDGVVLNIANIDYIINLDGSFIGRKAWSKFVGTPLYATYNRDDSKQTTAVSVLHYLTALYSYNPRKVDINNETGPQTYEGSPFDFVDELNNNFNGEYHFGEEAPTRATYGSDGFTFVPGWFGAEEVLSDDEKTQYLFAGFPDVMGPYKVIQLNTGDAKYKVFTKIGVGVNVIEASSTLMSNDYLGHYNEHNVSYVYTKGRIIITLQTDSEGEIVRLQIRLHATNNEDIIF